MLRAGPVATETHEDFSEPILPGKGASDWGYAWVPVLGPLLGAILAAFFVKVTGLG